MLNGLVTPPAQQQPQFGALTSTLTNLNAPAPMQPQANAGAGLQQPQALQPGDNQLSRPFAGTLIPTMFGGGMR